MVKLKVFFVPVAVSQGEAPSIPVCGVRVCIENGRVRALMVSQFQVTKVDLQQ